MKTTCKFKHAAVAALFAAAALASAHAQRHSAGSSPPTAPPQGFIHAGTSGSAPQGIMPVSTGLGALQFFPVNVATAAPQSITRQLESDDERTRQGALANLGVPSQYLVKGHVPYPHSVELEMAPLSTSEELDALLTVELDHHLVCAVLMPANGDWRRIGTLIFPTAFADPSTTPSTFLRTTRSLLQPGRYRAVFHARENQPNGDYTENEAHLRILNSRALITTSFVSDSKQCEQPAIDRHGEEKKTTSKLACQITQRWLQPDLTPGVQRFFLVTATGTMSGRDAANPLVRSRNFQSAHLKEYSCQPFVFSDANLRYEPTGLSEPCKR